MRFFYFLTAVVIFSSLCFSQVATVPVTNNTIVTVNVSTTNPLGLNGHKYAVTFNYVNDTTVSWNLNDITNNQVVYSNLSAAGVTMNVDGMSIYVSAPGSVGVKNVEVKSGNMRFTARNANLGLEGFNGAIGYADLGSIFANTAKVVPPTSLKNVLIKLAKVTDTADFNPAFDPNDENMSFAYRYLRYAQLAPAQAAFAPYILNTSSSYAFQGFEKSVPLSAWNVDDPANPKRLAVGHLENNVAGGIVDGKYWPSGNRYVTDNVGSTGPREWLFIYDVDYSNFPYMSYEIPAYPGSIPIMYTITVQRNGYVQFSPNGTGTDQYIIKANYKNIQADTVFFTAQARVNTYPNSTITKLNTNNVSTWISCDGIMDNLISEQTPGLYYPRGSATSAVFISGLVWGALVEGDNQPRVGGSTYHTGLQSGRILPDGTADHSGVTSNRIFRVRSDYKTADLNEEVNDEWRIAPLIKSDYANDWENWPAAEGAPFSNWLHSGAYTPNTDVPGFPGASQTTWFVANDLDASKTTTLYGAQPLGIEVQATFWNYQKPGALSNTILKKYLFINKGQNKINNMFITMWSDPDLGYPQDDFVGTDTTRNMVYCYNGNYTDTQYGNQPPAVGIVFLQTPAVPSPGDSAFYMGKYVKNKKNNPITGTYYYTSGDASVGDPTPSDISGSTQFYNFMRGKIGTTGTEYTDPSTGYPTKFVLAGDPITKTGWVDGTLYQPGDRRMGIASGPFNMAPGDSQEVVFAQIVAGAGSDMGNLAAISTLRKYCDSVRIAFPSSLNITVDVNDNTSLTERKFELAQNFPNPFNPSTMIKYQVPKDNNVSVKVYDVLGREVVTLVNEYKRAGKYTAYFNASNLSSGVYIYELQSGGSKLMRKMMLLK